MDKKVMREKMLSKRAAIPEKEAAEKSRAISERLFNFDKFEKANFIFSFISFQNEIDTHSIIKETLKLGKRVGVPITIPQGKQMLISELKDFSNELEIGFYDILTPKKEFIRLVEPKTIDLVLVPGLVFTPSGYRIGYGGGYYDIFLGKNPGLLKIALAYELQIYPEIPINSYDIAVDYIISENRIINCSNK